MREKDLLKISELMEKLPDVAVSGEDAPDGAVCPVCDGMGMVYPDVSVLDPAYGKVVECPMVCEAVLVNRERVRAGQMGRIMKVIDRRAAPNGVRLASYQPKTEDQGWAYKAACGFVDKLIVKIGNREKPWLVLVGEYGSGKTYLASAISNELEDAGAVCWYMKFSEMVYRYHDSWQNRDSQVTQHQVVKALQNADVLVLDDVFDEHVTDATRRLFFDVIDTRMDMNRPTVLTTNLTQARVGTVFGQRVQSRLVHMAHWVRMDGSVRDKTGVV